jgi:hypothetical protein
MTARHGDPGGRVTLKDFPHCCTSRTLPVDSWEERQNFLELNGAGIMAPLDLSLSDQERNGRERHSGQNADHEPIRRLALPLRFHSGSCAHSALKTVR